MWGWLGRGAGDGAWGRFVIMLLLWVGTAFSVLLVLLIAVGGVEVG
jgi:hypothetical protein